MRKTIIALAAMIAITGCTTAEQDAAFGGVAGAAIGAAVSGDAGGAVVGGLVGAASGVLIGQAARKGWCRYRDSRGRIYEARCRAG
jgi:hypothetical protein